ncbi:MAG: DUF2336 domain-containing protein [Alphaproteobacteria bacterium]|nr:DUF2336 domain-containing protein [Alphaproteobacteria bacterium]
MLTDFVKRLFNGRPPDYETAKDLARTEDVGARRRLAKRTDTRPELLYYLAADPSVDVRREIAGNRATPRQADLLLARDADTGVRVDLAEKIGRLAPELSGDERDAICRLTWQVLDILAADQMVRVRRILSEALKKITTIPPALIRRLAEDVELAVAAPVLEYSPLLSEEDLCGLIERGLTPGANAAIARRLSVGGGLAEAIVAQHDIEATAALLANHSAQIREETLDRILDRAPAVERWHAPLVERPLLPTSAVRRIASFVANGLLAVLQKRTDLDAETVAALLGAVEARLAREASEDASESARQAPGAPVETPETKAGRLHAAGRLNEPCLAMALDKGEHEFVQAGLTLRSELPSGMVRRVIQAQNAKGVTALAWKADLSMRFAMQLQMRLARIPPRNMLVARDGTEYPLSPKECEWQLELFESLGQRAGAGG